MTLLTFHHHLFVCTQDPFYIICRAWCKMEMTLLKVSKWPGAFPSMGSCPRSQACSYKSALTLTKLSQFDKHVLKA